MFIRDSILNISSGVCILRKYLDRLKENNNSSQVSERIFFFNYINILDKLCYLYIYIYRRCYYCINI